MQFCCPTAIISAHSPAFIQANNKTKHRPNTKTNRRSADINITFPHCQRSPVTLNNWSIDSHIWSWSIFGRCQWCKGKDGNPVIYSQYTWCIKGSRWEAELFFSHKWYFILLVKGKFGKLIFNPVYKNCQPMVWELKWFKWLSLSSFTHHPIPLWRKWAVGDVLKSWRYMW